MGCETRSLLAALALALGAAGTTLPAAAYEAGDVIVRAGAAVVDPRDSSGE